MTNPTFDHNGYPTEETLKTIETWDVLKTGLSPLIDFLQEAWHWEDWGFKFKKRGKSFRLDLHTGGWSGSEDIIGALRDSDFWLLYWASSRRGGHYAFAGRLPAMPEIEVEWDE